MSVESVQAALAGDAVLVDLRWPAAIRWPTSRVPCRSRSVPGSGPGSGGSSTRTGRSSSSLIPRSTGTMPRARRCASATRRSSDICVAASTPGRRRAPRSRPAARLHRGPARLEARCGPTRRPSSSTYVRRPSSASGPRPGLDACCGGRAAGPPRRAAAGPPDRHDLRDRIPGEHRSVPAAAAGFRDVSWVADGVPGLGEARPSGRTGDGGGPTRRRRRVRGAGTRIRGGRPSPRAGVADAPIDRGNAVTEGWKPRVTCDRAESVSSAALASIPRGSLRQRW